jgi:predicted transcriptional regulator
MRRTTISLPDELADALEREARRRSMPASAIARDALTAYLGIGGPGDQRELPFAALGRSGHSDTAREMETLLKHEWTVDAGDR